ncbi:MAG: circadian clock protein KaiB [Verrucomicrobiales bacterium]|nr:circadian clock protein KaiB [Verrucomicrobiales bacterium]MDB6130583.1 circadian clock protein KaiB [Verrucomicrobiales bacterium]
MKNKIERANGDGSAGQNGPKEKKIAWDFRLYIAGPTLKAVSALNNLKNICEIHLAGHYRIEVVDLMKHPQRAEDDQILAVPTLVRKMPGPQRRMIGNLSNLDRVVAGLDLHCEIDGMNPGPVRPSI